jgi:hypothetical protein
MERRGNVSWWLSLVILLGKFMVKKLLLAGGLLVAPTLTHADEVYFMFEGAVTQVRDNTATHALHDYHVGHSVRYQIKVDTAAPGWWTVGGQVRYPKNVASVFYHQADLADGLCNTVVDAGYLDQEYHFIAQKNKGGKISSEINVGSVLSISAVAGFSQYQEGMSFQGEELAHKHGSHEANSFIRSNLKLTRISPRIIPCG